MKRFNLEQEAQLGVRSAPFRPPEQDGSGLQSHRIILGHRPSNCCCSAGVRVNQQAIKPLEPTFHPKNALPHISAAGPLPATGGRCSQARNMDFPWNITATQSDQRKQNWLSKPIHQRRSKRAPRPQHQPDCFCSLRCFQGSPACISRLF